ncbi:MAG: hypothetical protein IJI44_05075 [Erysipelotrichaceae bacterium]|nr:hypothetical protein [Erysipelotrichaceae bacterium]
MKKRLILIIDIVILTVGLSSCLEAKKPFLRAISISEFEEGKMSVDFSDNTYPV